MIGAAVLAGAGTWAYERYRDHRAQVEWDRRQAAPPPDDEPPEPLVPAAQVPQPGPQPPTPPTRSMAATWMQSVGLHETEPISADERLEMIDRLALLNEPWCVETLEAAAREERDASVRDAALRALRALQG